MPGIELEPLGRKALRPLATGGTKRRDDRVDLAVFKGGANPAHAMDRVRRDSVRGTPKRFPDGLEALLEPARVMLFAGRDLRIDHDARKVIHLP